MADVVDLTLEHEEDEIARDYPRREEEYTGPARGVRNWCGTWNNYPEDACAKLRTIKTPQVVWGIFAKEWAPSTGTPHLQIYISFKNVVKYQTLRSTFPGSWWKPARGKAHQNYMYITKTRPEKTYKDGTVRAADVPNPKDNVFEIGTRPNFTAMLEGMIQLIDRMYADVCNIAFKDSCDGMSDIEDNACEDCVICADTFVDINSVYLAAHALLNLKYTDT